MDLEVVLHLPEQAVVVTQEVIVVDPASLVRHDENLVFVHEELGEVVGEVW